MDPAFSRATVKRNAGRWEYDPQVVAAANLNTGIEVPQYIAKYEVRG